MQRSTRAVCLLAGTISTMIIGCSGPQTRAPEAPTIFEVLVTSEAGGEPARPGAFAPGEASGTSIVVDLNETKQTIDGIGLVVHRVVGLRARPPRTRRAAGGHASIFGESGANFSLTRTHIGSCDFSVEGKYSYADDERRRALVVHHRARHRGVRPRALPGRQGRAYDLLPMIREAQAIKRAQGDELRIIASAWTAPPWMKDIEDLVHPGLGGEQLAGHRREPQARARADLRRLSGEVPRRVRRRGRRDLGLTPVNEPTATAGTGRACTSRRSRRTRSSSDHLGPALRTRRARRRQAADLRPEPRRPRGVDRRDPRRPRDRRVRLRRRVHWYASTFKVFEDTFERVNEKFPEFTIIHTEGCIDNLGNPAPNGIRDPEGFEEENWFQNDAFWWNPPRPTGRTAPSGRARGGGPPDVRPGAPLRPQHHRQPRPLGDRVGRLEHRPRRGRRSEPREQLLRRADHDRHRPGTSTTRRSTTCSRSSAGRSARRPSRALTHRARLGGLDPDALHACATINDDGVVSVQLLNTTKAPIAYQLRIGTHHAGVTIPANSVQTVRVRRSSSSSRTCPRARASGP
jgi:glucosylceramidase